MAIGIYKPGQGYWVRVLTAVGAGILVLATAAWLWSETAAIDLPTSAWDVTLDGMEGAPPAPGERVTVYGLTQDEAAEEVVLGTMAVESFTASEFTPRLRLVDPDLAGRAVPSDIIAVSAEGFRGEVAMAGLRGIPIVDPLYVQGALAAVVLLIGAIIIFWLVGAKPSTSEFLIATDGEMKKVNWSTRREVLGSTWVVIAASFLIAAALYLVDLAFQWFFVSIDVLQR